MVAFLQLYVNNLAFEWQRGPIKVYVTEEENRPFLRGKLLFQHQIRHNLIQQQRFYTAADEFTINNHLSRLLKAALRCCEVQRLDEALSRNARSLMLEFADVTDLAPSQFSADQITVNRQYARFESLVNLAKLILGALSPETGGTGPPIYSLMFDMNVVFERFVAAEMQAALADTQMAVKPQVTGRSLLTKNGKACFNLRPDIEIFNEGRMVCLIDTKWKRLDLTKQYAGVSQADVYQMYAYGKEYDVPLTVLLYPRWGNLPEPIAGYKHPLGHEDERPPKTLSIKTLDVSRPMVSRRSMLDIEEALLRCIESDKVVQDQC